MRTLIHCFQNFFVDPKTGQYLNCGDALWSAVRRLQAAPGRLRVICFASNGDIEHAPPTDKTTLTPPEINRECIWDVEKLLFTEEETEDLCERFLEVNFPALDPAKEPVVWKHLFHYTGGHPGIVMMLLESMKRQFEDTSSEIPLVKLMVTFLGDDTLCWLVRTFVYCMAEYLY